MTNLLLFKINAGWVELNRRPEDGDCALLILGNKHQIKRTKKEGSKK